jgi:hypothetical protein
MNKIFESLFDEMESDKIQEIENEILNVVPNANLVHRSLEDLIFKIDKANDIINFPKIDTTKTRVTFLDEGFNTIQFYVVYLFLETYDIEPIVVKVYVNGDIKLSESNDKILHMYSFKPKSVEELTKLPIDNIIKVYYNNLIDLNIFDFNFMFKLIKKSPNIIKGINLKLLKRNQLIKIYNNIPEIKEHLNTEQLLLIKKALQSPEEEQYYNENDTFVFLAREKFVELDNGMFKKDYEIESLNKIDPFDKHDLHIIKMLHIRKRIQGDVELYILHSSKGLIEDMLDGNLWKINKDEFAYLRNLIIDKSKILKT